MKRVEPKVNERIRALRDSLGLTQTQFADALDVAQAAVSVWESGKETPTSGAYVRMGNLAHYPDNLWFWKEGGLEIEAAKSAAYYELQRNTSMTGTLGETIRVPRKVSAALGLKDTGTHLALPTDRIANPFTTICLDIDEEFSGQLFSSGDVVIVDTFGLGEDLSPLLGHVVIAELRTPGYKRNNFTDSWPKARFITGTLTVEKYMTHYTDFLWLAKVGGHSVGAYSYVPEPGILINDNMGTRYAPGVDYRRVLAKAMEAAPSQARLFAGCRLFGTVLGWFKQAPKLK